MAEPPEGPVTFVNRFTVSGEPERFEAAFAETSRFMAEQAGFVRHTLLRALDRGAAVGYVNVAEWTDAAAFRAAVGAPGFARHAAELRALCSSDPALYEPVLHVAGAVAA